MWSRAVACEGEGYQVVGEQKKKTGERTSTVLNASSSHSPSNSDMAILACQRSNELGDCLFLPFLINNKDGTVDRTVGYLWAPVFWCNERDSSPRIVLVEGSNNGVVCFQKWHGFATVPHLAGERSVLATWYYKSICLDFGFVDIPWSRSDTQWSIITTGKASLQLLAALPQLFVANKVFPMFQTPMCFGSWTLVDYSSFVVVTVAHSREPILLLCHCGRQAAAGICWRLAKTDEVNKQGYVIFMLCLRHIHNHLLVSPPRCFEVLLQGDRSLSYRQR